MRDGRDTARRSQASRRGGAVSVLPAAGGCATDSGAGGRVGVRNTGRGHRNSEPRLGRKDPRNMHSVIHITVGKTGLCVREG